MASSDPDIMGVSLGMVIVDEIRMPNKAPLTNVLGGSATFVTFGQRLFASSNPDSVGCLVIAGDDFPEQVENQLNSWDITLVKRQREGEESTRGLLEYQDDTFGPKTFTYVHPPLRASPNDLAETPLLAAKAFHFFGTPSEIQIYVPELRDLRSTAHAHIYDPPFIIWEPFPASCTPANSAAFKSVCRHVNVFSPNHLEFLALCGQNNNEQTIFDTAVVEQHAVKFFEDVVVKEKRDFTLIVRCGEYGSLTTSMSIRPIWHPAFYPMNSSENDANTPSKSEIIDPTGAGNTFLGGYMAGWTKTDGNVLEAVAYGHVAASFAVEQIGLPKREMLNGVEVWNGDTVEERLKRYKRKVRGGEVRSESFV